MASCVFRPENKPGQNPALFDKIKRLLYSNTKGEDRAQRVYDLTWTLYGLALSDSFKSQNAESLGLNSEGFPSAESLIENNQVRKIIGDDIFNSYLSSHFEKVNYNLGNYSMMLERAFNFNKSNKDKIALVEQDSDGMLKISINNRSAKNQEEFRNQYASIQVAKAAEKSLSPLGISIGEIIDEKERINGSVDFSKAMEALDGSTSFIKIANNIEGAKALGEEFSHVIVRSKKRGPIIERMLNLLKNNQSLVETILGEDFKAYNKRYNGNVDLLSEEALGKLLHKHFINNSIRQSFEGEPQIKTLFGRYRELVKSKFKGKSLKSALNSLDEINDSLREFSLEKIQLTEEDIKNAFSDDVLFSEKEQDDGNENLSNIEKLLKKLISSEEKKKIVFKKNKVTAGYANSAIKALESVNPEDTVKSLQAIASYAKYAVKQLRYQDSRMRKLKDLSNQEKCEVLIEARNFYLSFNSIKDYIFALAGEEELAESKDNFLYEKFSIEVEDSEGNKKEVETSLINIMKQLSGDIGRLKGNIDSSIFNVLVEFIEPFLEGSMTKAEIRKMLSNNDSDISSKDFWLDSMADSNNQLLQTLETIRRTKLQEARLKSTDKIREIISFMLDYEQKGLTDFEFMFEKDKSGNKTGYYISELNYGQYDKDKKEFVEKLKKKYGKNLKASSVKDAVSDEFSKWNEIHSELDEEGNPLGPNKKLYHNNAFYSLSQLQKDFIDKFNSFKAEADDGMKSNNGDTLAIQIRKDGIQRAVDLMSNPSSIVDSVKQSWKSTYMETNDDPEYQTSATSRALKGFDGKVFNILPIYYSHPLEDPNELSTDVFRSLIAYTISANEYKAVDEALDGLELIRSLFRDGIIKTKENKHGKPIEDATASEEDEETAIFKDSPKINQKVEEWFKTSIFGEKMDDNSIKIGNKVFDLNKITSRLIRRSAMAQLGFNVMANAANLATGLAMVNIEAFGGKYFDKTDLFEADGVYFSDVTNYLAELNSRTKSNKLALFGELFNVKFQFDKRKNAPQTASAVKRLLGEDFAFMGQEGGDHWLYYRVAIAMAKHEKVKVPNGSGGFVEKSLWDVLEVKDSEFGHGQKKMVLPDGLLDSKGRPFSVGRFSNKIGVISHNVFGNYNDWDRVLAQKTIIGSCLLLYRRWIIPQFNIRFQSKQYNQFLEEDVEGYWRAGVKAAFSKKIIGLISEWDSLTEDEKVAVRKCATEVVQTILAFLSSTVMFTSKLKNRPYLIKLLEYLSKRELHELGNLTPSLIMTRELLVTINTPSAVISTMTTMQDLATNIFTPSAWARKRQTGPWKGYTDLEKSIVNLPFAPFIYYKQIHKLANIDSGIAYYNKVQSK